MFLVGTEGLGKGSAGCHVHPRVAWCSLTPIPCTSTFLPLLRSPSLGFGHWRCFSSSRAPAPAPLFQRLYLAELLAPLASHQSFFHTLGRLQLLTATSSPACRGKTPGGEIRTDVLKLSNTFSMATGTGANPISPAWRRDESSS